MLVPSIDIQSGSTVQLVGGREKALDAGDPRPLTTQFGRAGEIAVIDLDAAIGTGNNESVITDLLKLARCRVGGGIRSLDKAREWLDRGADKIILGTKALPDILRELPRERTIAALDALDGEVVVEGWRTRTGASIIPRILELRDLVSGFLITFVEREGKLQGTDISRVKELVEAAGSARVTIAGGVTTAAEIAELDRLGADAQVGMALYTGKLGFAEAFAAPLSSDRPDGLWPTAVCNEQGVLLGMVYSSLESLTEALQSGQGVYWSRSRGKLWRKGESSGATQELIAVAADCDRDALKFVVRQTGPGFCHLETDSCWGDLRGIAKLEKVVTSRLKNSPAGSYTKRLFSERGLLEKKLLEEARELTAAKSKLEVTGESADVLYFTLAKMATAGVSLEDVCKELDSRMLKVTRRPGDAKE